LKVDGVQLLGAGCYKREAIRDLYDKILTALSTAG
jgi:hypothetical protein